MQKSAEPIAKCWTLGTAEVDLPVERHQRLNGLDLRIVLPKVSTLMNKFIGKVFDGVTKLLECVPCFWGNAAGPVLTHERNWYRLRRGRYVEREAGSCRGSHAFNPLPVLRTANGNG
jgi:hypothetical protein